MNVGNSFSAEVSPDPRERRRPLLDPSHDVLRLLAKAEFQMAT